MIPDSIAVKVVFTVLLLTALAMAVAGYGGTRSLALLPAVVVIGTLVCVGAPLWRNRKRR
jgi:hypothetical protein